MKRDSPQHDPSRSGRAARAAGWVVNGRRFRNSAASFWPALVDEIVRSQPAATRCELLSSDAMELTPDMLFPERLLARDIERWMAGEAPGTLRETLAELEVLGEPPGVLLRVQGANGQVLEERPLEAVDADLLPYLVVWLLRWAGIAEGEWNVPDVVGRFGAGEPGRGRRLDLGFVRRSRSLSEGLWQRSLTVEWTLQPAVVQHGHA